VVTASTLISKVATHRQPKCHSFHVFPHPQKQKNKTTKDTSVLATASGKCAQIPTKKLMGPSEKG